MAGAMAFTLFVLVFVEPVDALRNVVPTAVAANASGSGSSSVRAPERRVRTHSSALALFVEEGPEGGLLQRAEEQLHDIDADEESFGEQPKDSEVWNMYDRSGAVHLDTHEGYLGRGAFSYVWPGRFQERWCMGLFNRGAEVDVAIKVLLRPQRLHESLQLANEELNRMRLFGPPHFLRSYGMCTSESHVGLVQERADFDFAVVLDNTLPDDRGFKFESVLNGTEHSPSTILFEDVLTDMLLGLKELDKKGFVHRDVKPQNVLFVWDEVVARYRAVLADLAFICAPTGRAGGEVDPFNCTHAAGTLEYLAPELWKEKHVKVVNSKMKVRSFTPTHKHDIFAAAVTVLDAEVRGWGKLVRSIRKGVVATESEANIARIIEDAATKMAAELVLDGRPVAKVLSKMVNPNPDIRCTAEECLEILTGLRGGA